MEEKTQDVLRNSDRVLDDARATAEAVRELAARLKMFTREREDLLAAERAARGEAEAATRQKDEFIAMLSHELRTPLANVLNWTHVLQERFADQDPLLKKGLTAIAENTTAQARLITDLLEVSRIDSGKVALELKPLDLVELVSGAAIAQRPTAEAKGVSLQFEVEGASQMALADPVRLQQVMWNLLSNAIKFTPRGGRILVHVAMGDGVCDIRVTDSGEGMAPEFLPHVFERFYQASGGSARRYGMGLGLALVKQLVELHGGQVHAHSEGVGKGATFTVRLPLRPVATHAPEDVTGSWKIDPQAMQPESLAGMRILAVDDQPAMLEHLARTLREHGAEVVAVPTGTDVLARLQAGSEPEFDVLISDIGMPQMDGFELIKRVRGLGGATAAMPMLACTAFAREQDRVRILDAGFAAHISKPIEAAQLITAVRELVRGGP